MLEIILGVLSSGGVGSITGLIGGYFNRKLDLEAKKIDVADRADARAHEVTKLAAEKDYMLAEVSAKERIVTVEGETRIEEAGYGAMAASYGFAAPTSADGLVDKVSKAVRPILTVSLVVLSVYIFREVNALMTSLGVSPDPAQVVKVWVMIIEWVLFQTGVCVGWWFAMRPGRQPKI